MIVNNIKALIGHTPFFEFDAAAFGGKREVPSMRNLSI